MASREATATRESALSAAVAMLEGGGIVAVKGLAVFTWSATRLTRRRSEIAGTQAAPDQAAGGDDPACERFAEDHPDAVTFTRCADHADAKSLPSSVS
ncbi:hypothetical protein ACVXG7_14555 [Enterobacter hormaechei]